MDFKKLEEECQDLIMEVDTNINLNSVILSDVNKARINEFITELQNADRLIKYGLKPMNKIMFFGDSGCGKTYLGKALSSHLKYKMLYVDIASAMTNNTVSRNLTNIFKLGSQGRCIIFLDEVDSIAWSRDGRNEEQGDIRRALNSLFQLIDQMSSESLLLCATNMLHRLDPAFKRRFDMELEFRRPSTDLKSTLKKFLHKEFTWIDDVNYTVEEIVNRRSTMSYYELQVIVEKEMKRAVLKNTLEVRTSALFNGIVTEQRIPIAALDEDDD